LFPIIYRKPGDVLLVVTKETQDLKGQTASLTLKAAPLGLKGDLLVLDIHNKQLFSTEVGEDNEVHLDVPLDTGPAMFRILNKPEVPTAIWHSPAVWHVNSVAKKPILAVGGTRNRLHVQSTGVPLSSGKIYLWCSDMGEPQAASGASRVLDYSDQMNMATISVDFDGQADNETWLQY
jgi:hypothetical protein